MKKLLHLVFIAFLSLNTFAQFPVLSSGNITNITGTSARINFSLNPNNVSTTAFVKYSTTLPFQTYTPLTAINGNTTIPLFLDITGLQPGTLYYWEVDAYNTNNQSSNTLSGSFTTLSPVPVISGVNASNITMNSAQINYSVNALGVPNYTEVIYGLSPTALNAYGFAGNTNTNSANPMMYSVTGLLPSTTYYYKVRASNSATSSESQIFSFQTLSSSTTPTISNVSTTNITETSSKIDFSVNAFGVSNNIQVFYGLSPTTLNNIGSAGTTNSNSANPMSYSIVALMPNTTYYYKVKATNAVNFSESTINSFQTLAGPNPLVAFYNFENNLNSFNNQHNLSNNAVNAATFGLGKFGQSVQFAQGQAIINSTLHTALNNAEYSIAWWEKRTADNTTFGTSCELFGSNYFRSQNFNTLYGAFINSASTGNTWISGNVSATATYLNSWTHYALVWKTIGTNKRLECYVNGILQSFQTLSSLPMDAILVKNNNVFSIGGGTDASGTLMANKNFVGHIDEFYVYNKALTITEINALKANDAGVVLASQNFNSAYLKASIYPNPATDNFTIEMENEVKSVEIYSIQGQKVMSATSKNVNVSNLSKGMYLVRIEDVDNAVATKKLIVE